MARTNVGIHLFYLARMSIEVSEKQWFCFVRQHCSVESYLPPYRTVITVCIYQPFLILYHNDKILEWSKLKAFADGKINVTEKLKCVLGRVENIVGKGENAGYQHFLLFPQCFQNAFFFF